MRIGKRQAWLLGQMSRMDSLNICHAAQKQSAEGLEAKGLARYVGPGGSLHRNDCKRFAITDKGREWLAKQDAGEGA